MLGTGAGTALFLAPAVVRSASLMPVSSAALKSAWITIAELSLYDMNGSPLSMGAEDGIFSSVSGNKVEIPAGSPEEMLRSFRRANSHLSMLLDASRACTVAEVKVSYEPLLRALGPNLGNSFMGGLVQDLLRHGVSGKISGGPRRLLPGETLRLDLDIEMDPQP